MKFRNFIVVMVVAAIPTMAMATDTPQMDKVTDELKAVLQKKGMSIAPTDMYLAATWKLRTELCGKPANDEMVKFHLKTASDEAPAPAIDGWYKLMKMRMKSALMTNPEEAVAFCK